MLDAAASGPRSRLHPYGARRMALSRLRKMTDDQLCRWVTARRGCYPGAEDKALEAFLLELPFNKKTPGQTGA